LGVAYAAFCVWLTVRFVNRRERWAKRTIALVIFLPLLYVLSLGPVCWLTSRTGQAVEFMPLIYLPIGWLCEHSLKSQELLSRYLQFWTPDSVFVVAVPVGNDRYLTLSNY
jgi:hypothetical protein